MAPAAHTTETPTDGNVDNGAAITVGVRFTVDDDEPITHIAFWVPTTNTGTYTVGLYETTSDDDPGGSGTGDELASASVAAGSVTSDAWAEVPLDTPYVPSPGVVYTAARHASSGRYVSTSGVFTGADISGGGVTLIESGADPTPPGLGVMRNGVFEEGAALAYPRSSFGNADYFVDVVRGGGQVLAIATASETDTAVAVGRAKARVVATVTATEVALSIGRAKSRALGTAAETDAAAAVGKVKRRGVGAAGETDFALPVGGGAPAAPAVFRVGPPELAWAAGPPGLAWTVGAVEV